MSIIRIACAFLFQRENNRTYAQRNGGRSFRPGNGDGGGRRVGTNIKGVNQLGDAKCAIGGG